MMAGRLSEYSGAVHHAPTLWVFGSKSQRLDSRDRDRRGAHRARLQRDPQGALVEPRYAELRGGRADRLHFGVRRRIGRPAHRVAPFRDDFVAERDHRANGNLARRRSLRGKVERPAHRRWQGKAHCPRLPQQRAAVSYIALLVTGAVWFCGGWTSILGTLTVASFEPTFSDPVSTSKAGDCPPWAETPFCVVDRFGALAPRTWLMSRKPVAIATMIATMAMIRMRRRARMVSAKIS